MTDELLEKIKRRGYWRIHFQPLTSEIKLDSMEKCKDAIIKNSVELRGWDFPHIPRRADEKAGMAPAGKYFEGWEDWSNYKEFWRMYKTGQFICYSSLREDWFDESMWDSYDITDERFKPGAKIGILGSIIYEFTEFFEFLSRLGQQSLYEEGVTVNISLHNTKGRALEVDAYDRLGFHFPRTTSAPQLSLEYTLTHEQVISNAKMLANKAILEFVGQFGWNPTPEQIEADQEKLLTRKL